MKLWILAILLLTLGMLSCRGSSPYSQADIEKEKFADDILTKVASQLKQETDLHPIGTIGQMLKKVQVLGLSFYYYRPVDIIEGRTLLVKAMNATLDEINKDRRIQPYLSQSPFTAQNIEIRVLLRSPDGKDVLPGALWGMYVSEGIFCYKIHNPATNRLITVYKETCEEAVQRVVDPSLPLVSFEPDPKISSKELARLRKNISFVADDGSICHLGEDGCWVKDLRYEKN